MRPSVLAVETHLFYKMTGGKVRFLTMLDRGGTGEGGGSLKHIKYTNNCSTYKQTICYKGGRGKQVKLLEGANGIKKCFPCKKPGFDISALTGFTINTLCSSHGNGSRKLTVVDIYSNYIPRR